MIGQTISHYRVLGELGRGGMGVVYEAEDILLGRRAALKFLPDEVAHEPLALARFQREARAASALNHPNICTIYEIGDQQGLWFIAMELLQGMPLDRSLGGKPVAIPTLLDWSIQIADALDIAHTSGIVHRDLKPANIFLTKRGQIKVLDFGLAKLSDAAFYPASSTSPEVTVEMPSPLTNPGQTVGTIAFMSPEQARGESTDSRSDLFSFGTVLYQMATGRMPFEGRTTAVVFDAILNREPISASQLNPETPAELQRIIDKCLEKDPDLRYQHASELRGDLKRMKRDTEPRLSSAKNSSSGSASLTQLSSAGVSPRSQVSSPASSSPMQRTSGPANESISDSSQIAALANRHRFSSLLGGAVGVLILAAAVFGIYHLVHRPLRVPFQQMQMSSLTSTGDNWAAAMSPDGKYVAAVRRDSDGRDSLWMHHLATNSNVQIVPPRDEAINDVTFAPDANYLYFRSTEPGKLISELYRVPVLGGPTTATVRDVDSAPSFNKAAARFCFLRYRPADSTALVMSANLDGSDEKILYSGHAPDYASPAWSPDGSKIALGKQSPKEVRIDVLDVGSGRLSTFARMPNLSFEPDYVSWTPDGRGLIVVYRNINFGRRQVGLFSYPSGVFHSITNDLNSYGRASISDDGRTLSTVLSTREESLEIFPYSSTLSSGRLPPESAATPLGSANWFDWVDNDRLAITDEGNQSIHLLSLSSGQSTPLFSGGDFMVYDLDGCGPNQVVVTASPTASSDVSHVYALDLAGGTPHAITTGGSEQFMRCTADGKWLVYFTFQDRFIRKMPVSGGPSEVLIAGDQHPSPVFGLTTDSRDLIAVVPSGAGRVNLIFVSLASGLVENKIPVEGAASSPVNTPDGKFVAFHRREHGVDNIWMQPVSGGPPFRWSDFHLSQSTNQMITVMAWSPDGKRLGINRRFYKGDVVVLKDLQQ